MTERECKKDPDLCLSCCNSIVTRVNGVIAIFRTETCCNCFHNPVKTEFDKYKSKDSVPTGKIARGLDV